MTDDKPGSVEIPILDVFDRKSLDSLIQHIVDSGALGRSKIYANLLRYLVDSVGEANPPKEIEVAINVLGRDTSFDVAKDSVVRVYIHQLRKKLDRYYRDHHPLKYGREPGYRLVIPKGEYIIAASYFEPNANNSQRLPLGLGETGTALHYRATRNNYRPWLIAATVLLCANLGFLFWNTFYNAKTSSPYQDVAKHSIWQTVLQDDTPLLLVVGDYYIFGELDEAGNVKRMVREFTINSKMDLEDLFMTQPELAWKYYDLDLSYIPEGSAFALNKISSVLPLGHKAVNVKMMSELTTQDITANHIIYVGYISGLDRLNDMVFAASGLSIGSNYDELVNKASGESYTSSAGLPSFHEPFTDYGFFSLSQSAGKKHIMIVAGMRDAGLIHTAEILASETQLNVIETALAKRTDQTPSAAFEVLYEVNGLNRKNFNAKLVYSGYMDSNTLWDKDSLNTSSSFLSE